MSNVSLPEWLKEIERNKYLMVFLDSRYNQGTKRSKMIFKLLTDRPELEIMWRSLKRKNPDYWFMDFIHDVQLSLSRTKFSRHSNSELKKYSRQISNLSDQLATLIIDSDFDTDIYSAMDDETLERLSKNLPPLSPSITGHPAELLESHTAFLWLSSYLKQVSKMAQKKGEAIRPVAVNNTKNSDQNYYIKYLTLRMRKRFNTPMRNVVATSASVIFDNPNIDVPYVAKYAP